MAGNPSSGQPLIKSDEIYLDTSRVPWMEFAKAELEKGVRELQADSGFISQLRTALTIDGLMRTLERQGDDFASTSTLLGNTRSPTYGGRFTLGTRKLPQDGAQRLLGQMEAARLKERNPEIDKYFTGLRTDPAYDKKGRAFPIASTNERCGYGNITAWCAAFVNWCLGQAGVAHLGYATAKSWLDFGTPVAHPVYGCIAIIKPSTSTGSTTGHVAFFVEHHGDRVVLLGGNQDNGTRVSEAKFRQSSVLGYRWPTRINHYLLGGSGVRV